MSEELLIKFAPKEVAGEQKSTETEVIELLREIRDLLKVK